MESPRPASRIEAALLDFHRHPGRYPAGQKSPAVLYASIKDVLQLAASRAGEAERDAPSEALKNAACFFVRTALLYRDADHYSLLGLDRSADAANVKEQYRWLMRLIHPDFASGSTQAWPADAAVRVNLAYEVLSSPDKRKAYDKQLDEPGPAPAPKIDSRPMGLQRAPRPASAVHASRHWLARMAVVFGGVAAVSILLLMAGQQEKDQLVQRAPDPREPATAATQTAAGRKALVAAAPGDARRSGSTQEPAAPARSSFSASLSSLFGMGSSPAPAVPPPLHARPQAPTLPESAAPTVATPPPAEAAPVAAVAPPAPPPPVTPAAPARVAVAAPPTPAPAPPALAMAPLNAPPATVSPAPAPAPAAAQAPPPSPSRRPIPGLTLAEAQPLLSNLLQQIESGSGDRMLNLLEREARNDQSAQALLRHYNSLVLGARPVKLSHVQFKAEPRDGRLLVTGMVRLQVGEQGSAGKELAMQAEFVSRDGTVVMTRLARAGGN